MRKWSCFSFVVSDLLASLHMVLFLYPKRSIRKHTYLRCWSLTVFRKYLLDNITIGNRCTHNIYILFPGYIWMNLLFTNFHHTLQNVSILILWCLVHGYSIIILYLQGFCFICWRVWTCQAEIAKDFSWKP